MGLDPCFVLSAVYLGGFVFQRDGTGGEAHFGLLLQFPFVLCTMGNRRAVCQQGRQVLRSFGLLVLGREGVDGLGVHGLAGLENDRREVLLVDRVRVLLGLEAEPAKLDVYGAQSWHDTAQVLPLALLCGRARGEVRGCLDGTNAISIVVC